MRPRRSQPRPPAFRLGPQVDSLCSARGDGESEAARRIKTQLMVEMQVGVCACVCAYACVRVWAHHAADGGDAGVCVCVCVCACVGTSRS